MHWRLPVQQSSHHCYCHHWQCHSSCSAVQVEIWAHLNLPLAVILERPPTNIVGTWKMQGPSNDCLLLLHVDIVSQKFRTLRPRPTMVVKWLIIISERLFCLQDRIDSIWTRIRRKRYYFWPPKSAVSRVRTRNISRVLTDLSESITLLDPAQLFFVVGEQVLLPFPG
jgi:hypothetical protein